MLLTRLFCLRYFLFFTFGLLFFTLPGVNGHPVLRPCALQHAPTDTTRPKPASRRATKPMILPGTRLDPRFRNIPAQDPAVARAAPAWLRAKAPGTPMYMVDGQSATAEQVRRLRPEQVASVEVLEGRRAARLYGPNAGSGMVIVTTQAGLKPDK